MALSGAARRASLPAVLILAAVQFTIIVDETAVALLAPSVGRDLVLGDQARHLLVTPFAAAFVAMLPVAVVALRRADPPKALPWAACAFAVSAIAGAVAPTTAALIVARAAQGATAAATTTCVLATLHLVTAGRPTRTRDFAVFSTVSGAGSIAALLVAGPLAALSWRWCFWAVAIAAVAFSLAWLAVGITGPDQRITPEDVRRHGGWRGLDWQAYAMIAAANAVLAASVITVSFGLQDDHSWSPIAAGLGFLPLNIAAAGGAIVVSRCSTTPQSAGRLLAAGFIALVVGCSTLAFASTGPAAMLVATVPIGLGIGIAFPLVNSRVLTGSEPRAIYRAAGLGIAQQAGLAVGAVVAAARSGTALAILAAVVAVGTIITASAALSNVARTRP
ncbi:MFS transporter [Gordonia sp. MP11Mi]|uniref:MFS transporter n=1 Tax=Gordonia sp. MP11Mi TaxID=3022769 RepID=A0AA97CUJ5_9ACTN